MKMLTVADLAELSDAKLVAYWREAKAADVLTAATPGTHYIMSSLVREIECEGFQRLVRQIDSMVSTKHVP